MSASIRSSSDTGTPSLRRRWFSPATWSEVKKEMEAKGFVKPIVASLAGDVEVEEAAEYLYQNGIPAYAYSTEIAGRSARRQVQVGAWRGSAVRTPPEH